MISAMEASYELFDHTADMGVRVHAPTMEKLIMPAVNGLYATIGELAGVGFAANLHFEESGEDRAILFRDLLSRVLLLFERDHRRVTELEEAVFSDCRLMVEAATAPIDFERSVFHREVKAVTYHELDIREVAGGYEATFIVDI
jgi:SHS2 domain-containing protein